MRRQSHGLVANRQMVWKSHRTRIRRLSHLVIQAASGYSGRWSIGRPSQSAGRRQYARPRRAAPAAALARLTLEGEIIESMFKKKNFQYNVWKKW